MELLLFTTVCAIHTLLSIHLSKISCVLVLVCLSVSLYLPLSLSLSLSYYSCISCGGGSCAVVSLQCILHILHTIHASNENQTTHTLTHSLAHLLT